MKEMYDIVAHIQCILVYPCIPVLVYAWLHRWLHTYHPL